MLLTSLSSYDDNNGNEKMMKRNNIFGVITRLMLSNMNEGQCYHCLNLIGCRFISRDCRNFDFVGNTHIESQSVLSLSCEVQL